MESGGPPRAGSESDGAPERPESAPATVGQPLGEPASRSSRPASVAALRQTLGTSRSGSVPGFVKFLPLLTGVVLAVAWFFMEGLPFADHDEYGSIALASPTDKNPKSTTLDIPEGDVYLYFEERGLSDQDSVETPDGLKVEVRAAGTARNSEPVAIEEVPAFLFSSQTGSTGWEPYGKLDVEPGRYAFLASARSSGFGAVTVGKPPINPFGPPIVGSILILIASAGITYLLTRFRRS